MRARPHHVSIRDQIAFQFRVDLGGDSGKRRTCEERILNLQASTAGSALSQAKRRGKGAEFEFVNAAGDTVYFEFIGVLDLLELGLETEDDEVWYNVYGRIEPMERRSALLPNEDVLLQRVSRRPV
jgi:Domain of unknown function (DUF4288)